MLIFNNKGINIVAAIIAVMLLGAMGAGMAYFVASNQESRIQQVTSDQSFYTVQAGLEFTLGQILQDGWTGTTMTRHFSGEEISITRSGGTVTVTAAEKDATTTHSIDDPTPVTMDCLTVDISSAYIGGASSRDLQGLTITRNASCTSGVIITSMTGTTWVPDLSEDLTNIRIDSTDRFTGPADGSGGTFDFGANDVTISDYAAHAVDFIRFNADMTAHDFQLLFNYTYNGSPYTEIVDLSFLATNQSSCFEWLTTSARLTWSGNRWKQLTGTDIENTCTDPIRLSSIATSWTPTTPTRYLNTIRVDGTNIFSGSATSGTTQTVDQVIVASTTLDVDYFEFDDEMLDRDYSITWTFVDGTSTTTPFTLFAANQNTCLNIDSSGAYLDGKYIYGLTFENTCSDDIGMTDLELDWDADPSNSLRRSVIEDTDGSHTFNSNSGPPASVSFGNEDLYVRNEDGTLNIDEFRFQSDIATGQTFDLEFTMADGTTYSTSFSISTQAASLSVDTSSASIGGSGDVYLEGITITNNGASAIVWDTVTVSWTPTSPTRKFKELVVDGSSVWSGTANTGHNKDITDVTINPGDTLDIDYFRFNSDMSGRTFTIEFIMLDASTYTEGPFSPPG